MYLCLALHSAQMLAPAESILPALMHYAGCTYFGIRQYVSPFAHSGRVSAAAFPRPRPSGRLAPASAWAVWPRSLPPVCSLPRVCYLSLFMVFATALLTKVHKVG